MKFTTATTTALTSLLTLTTAQPLDLHAARDTTITLSALQPRAQHTGKMTFYTPSQGSCGSTSSEADLVVAVPQAVYGTYANPNASPMCAKSVTITCPGGKKIKAAIKDKCMGCAADAIDVSPAVFSQCGSLGLGTMVVGWDVN